MKTETAMTHLAAYREGKPVEPRVSKALRCIENESAQRERLAEQVAFDTGVLELLGAITSPDDLRERLAAAQPNGDAAAQPRPHLRLILAMALGVTMIIAVLVFFHVQNRGDFPGRENLVRIASIANSSGGVELEPVSTAAGELGDWFYMRGYEGYRLPAELRKLPAVGSRIFHPEGHPVAQVAIDTHQSLVYVFKGDDFGVVLPAGQDWTIFPANECIAAAREFDNCIAMVTFQGTEADMKAFLETLKSAPRPHNLTTP